MPVQKITVTTTLLIEADSPEDAKSWVSGMSLSRIDDQMDQGEAVGQTEVGNAETVPEDRLKEELEALGSDMSFFSGGNDDQDEDAEA